MLKENELLNFSQNVPIKYQADVLVIGGGIAGVCTACAAARLGKKVIIVEQFATLGGNGTTGGVKGFCGETQGQGHTFDEIIQDLEKFKAIAAYRPARNIYLGGRHYNHEILAIILQEIVLRYGIQIFLHTKFVSAITSDSKVDYILFVGSGGLFAIQSKIVVDCSGECVVLNAINAPTMKGRPEDGLQLPMAMVFFIRTSRFIKRWIRVPDDYFSWKPYQSKNELPMISFPRNGPGEKSVKIKIPMFDSTSTEQLTAAEIAARRKIFQILHYYQRNKKNYQYDHCSPIIGIREGRRALGEYVLTLDDVKNGRQFPDAIAVGSYPLDAHKPDDDKRTYILSQEEMHIPPYHIPLRSLIVKGWKNLLVAGRNLSADQLAMSSARVMTTCAMMGEAVGTASSIALDLHIDFQNFGTEAYQSLKDQLEKGGTKLDLNFYQ
jgi:hypothetical protein